jgi:hypothetical protein
MNKAHNFKKCLGYRGDRGIQPPLKTANLPGSPVFLQGNKTSVLPSSSGGITTVLRHYHRFYFRIVHKFQLCKQVFSCYVIL